MMNVLIDTNIFSLAMRGDASVVEMMRRFDRIAFQPSASANFIPDSRAVGRKLKTEKSLIFSWTLRG